MEVEYEVIWPPAGSKVNELIPYAPEPLRTVILDAVEHGARLVDPTGKLHVRDIAVALEDYYSNPNRTLRDTARILNRTSTTVRAKLQQAYSLFWDGCSPEIQTEVSMHFKKRYLSSLKGFHYDLPLTPVRDRLS